jgi:REP-associated tyrosine transposase
LTARPTPSKLGEAKAAASCRTPDMRDWPHSPVHRLSEPGAYMVTGGTYLKRPIFRGSVRLEFLCDALLGLAEEHQWRLQAWAVFPNHYHFVALSPEKATSLTAFTKHLHSVTAIQANQWDGTHGHKIWFEYWDTALTYPESYDARLSYVHRNAVHHRVVREPSLYPWCSAGWFQRRATGSFYKRIMALKIDRVKVADDFEVDPADV